VVEVTAALGVHSRPRLASDLATLGLAPGISVLVHSSLRSLGPVVGGPATVVGAIRDVVGIDATIVVPAQTPNNSTTSPAFLAATQGMTPAEVADFEASMPGFVPETTPSFGMGALAEYIRRLPEATRSTHPQTSFAAVGRHASDLMAVHDLDSHLGERSPLAALYDNEAMVLLLGVGYESCTALHLAEYRLPWPPRLREHHCYVDLNGRRTRLDFLAPHLDQTPFGELGIELDVQPFVRSGYVGAAPARLLPMREAVDFAIRWLADRSHP
jgi:aminoglycoside 3-N-acetyltransferase